MAVSTKVPYVLIGASESRESIVQSSLSEVGHMAAAEEEIPDDIEEMGVLLVLISDELGDRQAAALASRLRHRGDFEMILLSDNQSTDLLRSAMRAGFRDLLSPTDQESLRGVFLRAEKILDQREENGDLIIFLGAKGGVGTSTSAIALSELLSRDRQNRVVLVDLNQGACFLPTILSVLPTYTTHDLLLNVDRMAPGDIRRAIPPRGDGFHLLPQPSELPDSLALMEEDLDILSKALKRAFTHVVLDLGARLSEPERAVIRQTDHIYLVTAQTIPSLRPAVRRLDLLKNLAPDAGVHMVVNSYSGRDQPDRAQIAEQLNHPILCTVSFDGNVLRAQDDGQTVHERAPRSAAARDLERLLVPIAGEVETEEKPKRRWWPLG